MTDALDLELAALLAAPARVPDRRFTERVTQAVLAEERLRAASRRGLRRLAAEAAATVAVLLGYLALGSWHAPAEARLELPLTSPAMAAVLLLGLWAAVGLRPRAGSREGGAAA